MMRTSTPRFFGFGYGFQQRRVGEDEHFYPERFFGAVDGVEDGFGGVVGQNDQVTGCRACGYSTDDGVVDCDSNWTLYSSA